MKVTFRKASHFDSLNICNLLLESIKINCVSDHKNDQSILDTWCKNKTPQQVLNWINDPQNVTITAESDTKKIIGVGQITSQGKITLCYLRPGILGKGIGTLLLKTLEKKAMKLKISRLHLNSTKTALQFYLKNGYTPYGAPIKIDNKRTCYPMEKNLT